MASHTNVCGCEAVPVAQCGSAALWWAGAAGELAAASAAAGISAAEQAMAAMPVSWRTEGVCSRMTSPVCVVIKDLSVLYDGHCTRRVAHRRRGIGNGTRVSVRAWLLVKLGRLP